MKTEDVGTSMRSGRRGLSWLAGLAAGTLMLLLAAGGIRASAQEGAGSDGQTSAGSSRGLQGPPAPPASPTDLAGTWQATLTPPNAQKGQRIVIKVRKDPDGTYIGTLYNADRGGPPLKFATVTVQGADVKFATPMATVEVKMSPDGKTLDGNFNAGGPNPLPVSFARATPDTEWPIPEPIKPMAADAKPGFDVVTVKPSPPGRPGKNIGFDGHRFLFRGANLDDMIALGYGLHTKQIVGAPDWAGKDLFDVEGTPDVPGMPNQKQMQSLLQNLLADRFQLKFHNEKRDLAVYVITVAPGGPKLTQTTAAPNDPSGMGFGGVGGGQGVTAVGRNLTMPDFAMWFQSGVTDRPVVDQTGIKGRYDFRLKWTPDDSQFAQFGGSGFHAPPPSDAADAPPNLYTAIQEQLGLKIDATKAPDDVMVIDHVDKPSPN
jgi:uncharacterized protein (TIGR03435 family)